MPKYYITFAKLNDDAQARTIGPIETFNAIEAIQAGQGHLESMGCYVPAWTPIEVYRNDYKPGGPAGQGLIDGLARVEVEEAFPGC